MIGKALEVLEEAKLLQLKALICREAANNLQIFIGEAARPVCNQGI